MSRYGYLTTTVEYYEYLVPETQDYNYETVLWPSQSPISDNYVNVNYLDELQHQLAVACENNRPEDHLYDMVTFPLQPRPEHRIFEYGEQEEPQEVPCPPNYRDVNGAEDQNGNQDEDATPMEPPLKETRSKKNIYRAEQGYLVEEPTSESDEEKECTETR